MKKFRHWKLAVAIAVWTLLFPLRVRIEKKPLDLLPQGFRAGVMCLLRDQFPAFDFRESEDPNRIDLGTTHFNLVGLYWHLLTARTDPERAKRAIVHEFQETLWQACFEPEEGCGFKSDNPGSSARISGF